MKIYFAGSIRGGREDVSIYSDIIKHLQKYGEVMTEHVADPSLQEKGEKDLSDNEIHDRDMDWLIQSDVIVAEVTTPSLGVGYEVKAAVDLEKKVLCLYRPQQNKRLSAMISGCSDVSVYKYNQVKEALRAIDEYFNQ